jgi:LysB family phage lysis regulatory protein
MGNLTGIMVKVLLSLLVVGLLGTKILFQRQELIAEKEKNATLIKDKTERDAMIQQLQEVEAENKKRLEQLHTESRRITQTLAKREAYIEQLQHDDQQIQPWADTPLPDAIVRLRQRNAATGAGDYIADLPER